MLRAGVVMEDNAAERRRERERLMLEEGEALWRAKQRQQWICKLQEQREARDMLLSYAPWGRPGCGAPNNDTDVRKKKLIQEGGIMAAGSQHYVPQPPTALTLGRPGCGAPLRSRSGRLQAAWRADPVLRFHEPGRRCVDNELRYRASSLQQHAYRTQLDQLVLERRRAQSEARKSSTLELKRMLAAPEPWGRPGPGGTAWRPRCSTDTSFLHSLGWSSEPTLSALAQQQHENDPPPPSSPQQPEYAAGKAEETPVERHRQASRPQAAAITAKKQDVLQKRGIGAEPGAGFELVPLLARRRAALAAHSHLGHHHPPWRHPLCSTDITRYDVPGIPEPKYHEDKEYLQTLRRQVAYKQKHLEEMRLTELQTTQRHFETWRQFWGRPGHGAPKPPVPRITLADLLAGASPPRKL